MHRLHTLLVTLVEASAVALIETEKDKFRDKLKPDQTAHGCLSNHVIATTDSPLLVPVLSLLIRVWRRSMCLFDLDFDSLYVDFVVRLSLNMHCK